ncbi:hypothetical protein JCM3774_006745 [Rhodotorula dairenensis]
MPSPSAASSRSPRRRLPGATILALCLVTAGWVAFAVLAPAQDYTDFESQRTAAAGLADALRAGDASAAGPLGRSGAAPPSSSPLPPLATLLHPAELAAEAGTAEKVGLVGGSDPDADLLEFTVQHDRTPASRPFAHNTSAASASSLSATSRDSFGDTFRLKLDKAATLLGDFLLGLFGIEDGAEWFSEGDYDYETSQSGLDGGALSSWSESSVYVERTNSLHPSRPSSFGPHILDEPLRGYLFPIEYASSADAYACSSTKVAPVRVRPTGPWIALIQRGKCPFSEKVRFAQRHGAEAVVFGDQSESEGGISGGHGLLTPWSPENTDDIKIPSTFVSRASYLSLIRTWKDEQDIVKQKPDPLPPMHDGSTQTNIAPRDGSTEYVGLEVVLSKDEMLASPFLDLLFVLLFLPSLLTLVTVFVQRIRLARAAQAERAPKDAVARLPVFRWGDHVTPPAGGPAAINPTASTSSVSNAAGAAAPEKPAGRPIPSDEEREVGVEAQRPRVPPPQQPQPPVSTLADESEPDEATTLLPHSSSATSTSGPSSAPSLVQRAFARLPFVVQRFLPSFLRPRVPAGPASSPSARSSRLNDAVPTRRFPSIVECPFCLCDFENGDSVMELPCGHLFHDDEVRGWLEGQKGVCPVCRTSVLNPSPTPAPLGPPPPPPAATAATAAGLTLDEPTGGGGGGGTPRSSSTRTDTTLRPTQPPIASTSSVRIEDPTLAPSGNGAGRPRSL